MDDQFREAVIDWMQADATLVSRASHSTNSPSILVWDERYRDRTPLVALLGVDTMRLLDEVDEVYLSDVVIHIQTAPSSDSVGTTADSIARRLVAMVERTTSGDAAYTSDANVKLDSIVLLQPPTGSDFDEDTGRWETRLTLRVMWRRA